MAKTEYRGWIIEIAWEPFIPAESAYLYAHRDYDGPEDDRCGRAASVEAAIEAINEKEGCES